MSSEQEEEEYVLPLDILIEIFKRLPVKSLIKFTSVSKQWKSVIRSSRFTSEHNNIQQQQTSNLFLVVLDDLKYHVQMIISGFQQRLTLPGSDDNFRNFDSPHLIGYSHGLFGYHNNKDRLVIWNPSIKKSIFIPLPDEHARRYGAYLDFWFTVVCNATDPTIFCITYTPQLKVQIYTLSAAAWRTVSYTPPRESLQVTIEMIVTDTDRFIYWTAIDRAEDGSKNYVIMSFDITSEQFTELCLPPTLAEHAYLRLSKLRESLVVLETYTNNQEIGVWMMKVEAGGVENSFTKKFIVNLPAHTYTFEVKVFGFTKDSQIILEMKSARELVIYEPGSKSFKFIRKVREKEYPRLAGSYMETLLLFDH